ncbi:hypothetical protein PSN45_002765 [Yamadazyma tenuis]|uniref:Uncharacterized protein n=1 Tax=Candida tenuis (strain ATCC 10573 / BCRC 21748 / CBS 615 / JCM 9827 / NBRC 10315 / NRRL Y-1498 / VKM Y-70) TaxID=590646 RepID=G3AWV2_CANTC|nr:uncharacterized protein CANTEDRAFT_112338 [Yamadazyma tenuis ATCC 10573]EGV66625.1 hypothetical protein CANTEDRAFT_112338 [Yamadazyma tenuis ATCC 10573]WEJ95252.1 hypothetical protein PSN45_002765 [Yamadazyma tenuis]
MSTSSLELNDANATVGLTTPQLHDGEVAGDVSDTSGFKKEAVNTVFDVALSIDTEAKQLLETLVKNDDEITDRLESISVKIRKIRSQMDDL